MTLSTNWIFSLMKCSCLFWFFLAELIIDNVKHPPKPFGIDDGFKGAGAACGSSIVKVAHQMVSAKSLGRGFAVAKWVVFPPICLEKCVENCLSKLHFRFRIPALWVKIPKKFPLNRLATTRYRIAIRRSTIKCLIRLVLWYAEDQNHCLHLHLDHQKPCVAHTIHTLLAHLPLSTSRTMAHPQQRRIIIVDGS